MPGIFSLALFILFLAVIAIASLRQPAVGVVALIVMYALEQWAQGQGGFLSANPQVGNFMVAAVVPIAVGSAIFRYGVREVLWLPPVQWLTLILFAFGICSYFWTRAPEALIDNWIGAGPFLLLAIFFGPLVVTRPEDLQVVLRWSLVIGLPLSVLLLASEWGVRGVVIDNSFRDQLGNPLAIGEFGGVLAIIAALYHANSARWFYSILRWAIFLLGMVLAFKSESRGQTLGALAIVLLFLPYARRFASWKGFMASAFGIIVVVVASIFLWQMMTSGDRWEVGKMTGVYQGERLKPAIAVLSHWFHAGPLAWFIGLGQSASYDPDIYGFYPHFVPAEVLAELGFVGFGLYATILWFTLKTTIRAMRLYRDDPTHRAAIACTSALACYSILLSLKQGSLIGTPMMFLFAICLARAMYKTVHHHATVMYQPELR